MNRAAIQNHAVNAALMQASIKLAFIITFGKKLRMTHFNAVMKRFRQAIEKCPKGGEIAWAKGRGKLPPILADSFIKR